jgi:hypothetical protein
MTKNPKNVLMFEAARFVLSEYKNTVDDRTFHCGLHTMKRKLNLSESAIDDFLKADPKNPSEENIELGHKILRHVIKAIKQCTFNPSGDLYREMIERAASCMEIEPSNLIECLECLTLQQDFF